MKNSFIKGMLTACVLTLIGVYSCEEYYIGKKYLENLEKIRSKLAFVET